MKIFGNRQFRMYIREVDHPPPHCHVRFGDKTEVCVTIPLVEPMYGAEINHRVRSAIEENMEGLTKAWDKFHPKRKEEQKAKKTNEK
jgi:hypothetical protein